MSPAQILYSPNEDLEKILNKNLNTPLKAGLSDTKIKNLKTNDKIFEKNIKSMSNKIKSTKIPLLGKIATSALGGPDAAGMLNLAEDKKLPIYTKDTTKLININDRKLSEYDNGKLIKFKPYIEDKVLNQFKDFGYNLNSIEGKIFHNNSAPT